MTLTQDEVWRRQAGFIHGFIRWIGSASAGAEVWEAPGVSAAIVPAAATRSIPNSVIPESAQALASSYDELARAYRDAGVKSWTVWLHEGDSESQQFLEDKGHVFDGAPVAMALELSDWEAEDLGDLDWDAEAGFDELGRINDLAYGYDPPGMAPAIASPAATSNSMSTALAWRARSHASSARSTSKMTLGSSSSRRHPRCAAGGWRAAC